MEKDKVKELHEKISSMALGDLLLLAGQAINNGFNKNKVDLILEYVELAIRKRRLEAYVGSHDPS